MWIGYYNRHGYRIENLAGTEQHGFGNMKLWDSQQQVSPGSPDAASLRQIRSWCIRTGREIAKERHGKWLGAEREESKV